MKRLVVRDLIVLAAAAGTHTVTLAATDSGGNTTTSTVRLTVTRVGTPPPGPGSDVTFGGFSEPVATGLAHANAGSTIPFKWSLSGPDAERAVLSAQFTSDGATYAITRSGLVWHVNSKTPKAWAGTTQTFRVTLVDGTVHDVQVAFR